MATVYLAIQESFEREVALKVMSPALSADPTFGERFIREARIVSRLMHPNIVTVYDVGVCDGHHFLSMEYVPGSDLRDHRSLLSRADCLRVVTDVARALDYAGKKGYVHRDVKPENIMLHNEDARAVLMDFGIARAAEEDSSMTRTGTAIGTPHYMSPEQAKGTAVDSRSDIYSLGVVFYLLLEGHMPFDADSAVAVGIKHLTEPVPRLRDSLRIFQQIIDRALAKDPAERYQTGAAMIADLQKITAEDLEAIAALDAAAQSQDFEALGDDEPTRVLDATPVDGETVTLEAESETQIAAVTDEFMTVDDEDRLARSEYEPEQKRGAGAYWALGVLLTASLGGGYYYLEQQGRSEALQSVASPAVAVAAEPQHEAETQIAAEPLVSQEVETRADQVSTTGAIAPAVSAAAVTETADAAPEPPAELPKVVEAANTEAADTALEKAQALHLTVEKDLQAAPQVAQAYRDLLEQDPQNLPAEQGLQSLNSFLIDAVESSVEAQDWPQARSRAEVLLNSFADARAAPRVQTLLQALDAAEALSQLLSNAAKYLATNALTAPKDANALGAYRQVLADYPDNAEAKKGISKIVSRYGVLSDSRLQQGKLEAALKLADRGLKIAPETKALQSRRQNILELQQERQRAAGLLADAETLLELGQLIAPPGDNALQKFRTLLAMSLPHNLLSEEHQQAQQGVADLTTELEQRLRQMISGGDLDAAEPLLLTARELLPQSDELLRLETQLEGAIEGQLQAELEATSPKVARIVISNSEMSSISDVQAPALQVDRTIHIGFIYKNFEQTTSVVQAILFDGSRSLKIAEVPVIVTGKGGVKFFRIDRPVDGFADGGYNIDLVLGGKALTTATFQVESGARL